MGGSSDAKVPQEWEHLCSSISLRVSVRVPPCPSISLQIPLCVRQYPSVCLFASLCSLHHHRSQGWGNAQPLSPHPQVARERGLQRDLFLDSAGAVGTTRECRGAGLSPAELLRPTGPIHLKRTVEAQGAPPGTVEGQRVRGVRVLSVAWSGASPSVNVSIRAGLGPPQHPGHSASASSASGLDSSGLAARPRPLRSWGAAPGSPARPEGQSAGRAGLCGAGRGSGGSFDPPARRGRGEGRR